MIRLDVTHHELYYTYMDRFIPVYAIITHNYIQILICKHEIIFKTICDDDDYDGDGGMITYHIEMLFKLNHLFIIMLCNVSAYQTYQSE